MTFWVALVCRNGKWMESISVERAGMFLEASSGDEAPAEGDDDRWRVESGPGGRASHVVVCGIELAVREGGPVG